MNTLVLERDCQRQVKLAAKESWQSKMLKKRGIVHVSHPSASIGWSEEKQKWNKAQTTRDRWRARWW